MSGKYNRAELMKAEYDSTPPRSKPTNASAPSGDSAKRAGIFHHLIIVPPITRQLCRQISREGYFGEQVCLGT